MFLLYHAYVYLEFLILACTIYILAPFWIIIQEGLELFQTLKLAPQVCPSNQPLTTDPQLVRQTLKNFDYPI